MMSRKKGSSGGETAAKGRTGYRSRGTVQCGFKPMVLDYCGGVAGITGVHAARSLICY